MTGTDTNAIFGLKIEPTSWLSGYFGKKVISESEKRKILAKNPLEGLFGKSSLGEGLFGKNNR